MVVFFGHAMKQDGRKPQTAKVELLCCVISLLFLRGRLLNVYFYCPRCISIFPAWGKTKSLCFKDKVQVVGTQKISLPDALLKAPFG